MSSEGTADPNPAEPESVTPAPANPGAAPAPGRLITLRPYEGQEPPAGWSDAEAEAVWIALTAPWHPALLARFDHLPEAASLDAPGTPESELVHILPRGLTGRLPEGFGTQALDAGAPVLETEPDRAATVAALATRLELEPSVLGEADDPLVRDFYALGLARWLLRDLTLGMAHADTLDLNLLTRETLDAARAWVAGDRNGTTNRLRAAFELLTQARERFYATDAFFLDLALLDPTTPAGGLGELLGVRTPFTVLAPAHTVAAHAAVDPDALAALRTAIDEGWADVVGGPYEERDEPLRPFESILWQYRHGAEVYRQHLDDRTVETFGRRRFGLYPLLPQIARRFAIRFGLHLGFDAGTFPVPPEAKRLWESPDGAALESLTRSPLPADRAAEGLRLPWTLARSMRDDHVATVPLVHWPERVAGWFADLRRAAVYSPVLARWVTIGDYFHLTDRPWDTLRPTVDDYRTPYLDQAVRWGDTAPIGGRARHARLRGQLDSLLWADAVAHALALGRLAPPPPPAVEEPGAPPPPAPETAPTLVPPETSPHADLERQLETDQLDDAAAELATRLDERGRHLAGSVRSLPGSARPGFLVFNPLAHPRRVAITLPDADLDLAPTGPLRVAQFTDEGVRAVVDLPASGFAWVPRHNTAETIRTELPLDRRVYTPRGTAIQNDFLEADIDPATGGLRSIRLAGETEPRVGQQLVLNGLTTPDGQPLTSKMVADSVVTEYGGPAMGEIVSRGRLINAQTDQPIAAFRQRLRLWAGRPLLELRIELSDLDPRWFAGLGRSDPWARHLACRWAWPDPESSLRRLAQLGPEPTKADRPETAEALEIASGRYRTGLYFGGLAHHRRQGPRMLDTLLIAGRETTRTFDLAIGLDLEHPFQAHQDLVTPPIVVPTDAGPPKAGSAGWFFHIDRPSVAVTRVEPVWSTGEERGPGLAFHLLETANRSTRCRLRLYRSPLWARQTDLQGDLIVDLARDGDAILIDLTPRELARVEVTLA